MIENLSEEDLVERARRAPEGDLRAFELLVDRHQERLVANCRHLTRHPNDAQDLAQEVFVKAFFGLARFEGRSGFGTWIRRIKVNHCLNFLKKMEGKVHIPIEEPGLEAAAELQVEPEGERHVSSAAHRAVIRSVLDSIPDTLRIPLVLRDMDHFSYQEIADFLKIGLSAVKMRIKRGREEFRQRFGDHAGGAGSGATVSHE